MQKLKLKLEDLRIDSFATTAVQKENGTVFGEQCTCYTNCTCPGCPTCYASCGGTCDASCNGTCGDSCDASCGTTCSGGTCFDASCDGSCGGWTCDRTCQGFMTYGGGHQCVDC